ncbi:MAG: hypothetical protein L0Y79_09500, partial [Chlorobi bacterium]|nr:hypothetical protein [Chlorobiota bacterium]
MNFKNTLILIIITSLSTVFAQEENPAGGELIIYNRHVTEDIKVVVYPIGAIFNGNLEYKLKCLNPQDPPGYQYIVGGEKSGMTYNISFELDHDAASGYSAAKSIGYGKYRVEIYKKVSGSYQFVDYVDVD